MKIVRLNKTHIGCTALCIYHTSTPFKEPQYCFGLVMYDEEKDRYLCDSGNKSLFLTHKESLMYVTHIVTN